MTNKERIHAMILLQHAIDLAGDGEPQPFDEDEYELMDKFLKEIKMVLKIEE